MEKLIIPKNCVVEGSLTRITNEGDIQIENGQIPQNIESVKSNVRVTQIPQNAKCEALLAPAGELDLQGDSLQVDNLLAMSLTAQFRELDSQNIQATQGTTYINGEKIKIGQLSSDTVEIEGETVHIGMLRANGKVSITAKNIHIEEIEATEVHLSGHFESSKVTATEGFFISSGHVAIKNLDAPSFFSDEGVGGIVMVASCDKVQTQGVRGFLRPAELGLFSKGGTTLDLSEVLGGTGFQAPPKMDESKAADTSTSTPTPEPSAIPEIDSDASDEAAEEDDQDPQQEIATHDLETVEPVAEPEEEPSAVALPEISVDDQDDDQEDDADEPTDVVDINALSMRTTVVVDDEPADDDDGEMKTIQLAPEALAEVIEAKNQGLQAPDDVLEPEEAVSDENEVELSIVEEDEEEAEDLPEISGFDDYQTTGEIVVESADLDDPLEDDDPSVDQLDMPSQDEDLWDEASEPSEEIQISELEEDEDIEVEELSEDDFYSVDEEDFSDEGEAEDTTPPEAKLRSDLTETLNEIRSYFPDENYPKFIYQIQNYVNEGRFNILAKPRNRDAVLSSFEKLNHPQISTLSSAFYNRLSEYFENQ